MGLRTPNLGEGEAVWGRVWYVAYRFYRPSIVTFHLSLRVSEILPLLCSSAVIFAIARLSVITAVEILIGDIARSYSLF